MQLRTGKTFLKEYMHKPKASETALCDRGCIVSTPHFLFSCSRWEQQRAKLRQQHRGRFGDLSYALGGYSSRQEGSQSIDRPINHWKPNMDVVSHNRICKGHGQTATKRTGLGKNSRRGRGRAETAEDPLFYFLNDCTASYLYVPWPVRFRLRGVSNIQYASCIQHFYNISIITIKSVPEKANIIIHTKKYKKLR